MLKEQHIMTRSKEIQDENVSVWKGLKGNFWGFGMPANFIQSHYPQMEKTWNSGEPSQECLPKLLQERNDKSSRRS